MSLRTRLIYLLATFAVFVVIAVSVTIYGTQLHIAELFTSFRRSMDQTGRIDRIKNAADGQISRLRDIVDGRIEDTPAYRDARVEFFNEVERVAGFAAAADETVRREILDIKTALERETTRCLSLVRDGNPDEARELLGTRVEGELLGSLHARLNATLIALTLVGGKSLGVQNTTLMQVIVLAIVVVVLAAGLMIVGARLIRRWLIVPITELRHATEKFSARDLSFRVSLPYHDELGALGNAMNSMAASLETAQAELHTSEAKYRVLFENLRDAVVICDIEGSVIECHEGDTRVFAFEGIEHIGRRLVDIWPQWGFRRLDWPSLIERVITSGRPFRAADVPLRRAESAASDMIVDVIVYPVAYDNMRYAAIVLRDVTERELLQRRVRHADKMEATGTLAGGIAHDFNNLLTSAIGTLSLLGNEIVDERQNDLLQTALRASWQAAGLSRRLLDFASGGSGRPQVLRLREVVTLVLGSLDASVFDGIDVACECHHDVLVRVDRDQLTQIILNLVRNACDAMSEPGSLRVSVDMTADVGHDEKSSPQPCGVLTVTDTGGGMTPEVKERLFEPLFTTKVRASHRGRGLGLAIVYASVKSAGGFIQVDSELGVGTTFRVYLPVGEGVPEPVERPAYAGPAEKGHGTVLVVDDEPMIVRMCVDALQRWGYAVVSADSITDAAQKFDSASDDIALALIDINLPDGSGVLLAQDLVSLSPELRIVFATGFGDTSVPPDLEPNVCGRLAKPFALDQLSAMLSAALSPTSHD